MCMLKVDVKQPPDLQIITAMHVPNLEMEDRSHLHRIGHNN